MIQINEELKKRMKGIDWRQHTMDEKEFKIQVKEYAQIASR